MNQTPIKITAIMWGSYLPTFLEAAKQCPMVELSIFSQKDIQERPEVLDRFWDQTARTDLLFFYWTADGFWEEIEARIQDYAGAKTVVTTSFDHSNWRRQATVDLSVCARAYAYLAHGGQENCRRLLHFLARQVLPDIEVQDPVPLPWQGILHPPDWTVYGSESEYRKKHPGSEQPTVGLLFSRHTFTNTDGELERELIEALQDRGLNVLPVFTHSSPDPDEGALGPVETGRRFFICDDGRVGINALVNLNFFFLGREQGKDMSETGVAAQSVDFLKDLNVPVFKPVVSYSKSVREWEEDAQGLCAEVTFGIAMPEFEGNIEPVLMACSQKLTDDPTGTVFEIREAIADRIERLAERIARWTRLAAKPPKERRAVFVLHKNECAGLEATLGGAAGLDSGQSVVNILKQMQKAGYKIEDTPASGEDLMQTFLRRKAIAEFRWTTVDEIVSKGGHLALLDNETYTDWFNLLPEMARERLVQSWGQPPGQELNGVPPSMVLDDKLVITGLNFGNVNIIMQPKRGCAGSRCDGRVCKILHDPDLPPPHQYIATYMYMDRIFGADVIIHVGTHGNLEWLPGKGAGLSASCWPDIAIGDIPHLYIYNADNPAEGVVAKRRSYAVLADHLQAVMTTADTYGGLEEVEELLNEYHQAKDLDPARAHQLEHLISEALERHHLAEDLKDRENTSFEELAKSCHEIISKVKNSQTRTGMHIFGSIPQDRDRAEMINTILRFDSGNEINTRRLVFDLWGEDIKSALREPGERGRSGRTYGELLYDADRTALEFIDRLIGKETLGSIVKDFLPGKPLANKWERLERFAFRVLDINRRLDDSQEIQSLLSAMDGGYVPPGPSGFLSRGRFDILPTGRNFYNVDPTRIPTKAAWRVGVQMAEALLKRHLDEEGRYPQTVGMVWLASDIMRADGEQICQIMHLLGTRPKWRANGQVDGFEIVPVGELGRPRVDVNIRVSGISRDCFPEAIKFLDRVVQTVALLQEDPQVNTVRKHVLDQAAARNLAMDDPNHFRKLSYRIFCAQPGAYKSGVDLAVYASAWKTESDLSDVYIFWNGYAYGDGEDYGVQAHQEMVDNLSRVEVAFDKHISDESDFLSCCAFFSNYGGMASTVKTLSGKAPKTYYGDSRDPAMVTVTDFADEMRRVVRAKLLHPTYIQGMQKHGYKGAGDLSSRIGRVYGFGATTGKVDNWIFDQIAETFMLDKEMKTWFEQVNPYALEEIGRRLLEAQSRGIWKPDPEVLQGLQEAYLEAEASIEDRMGDVQGDFQGGAVEVMTAEEVQEWKAQMQPILDKLKK
jgi:cobaltochelatase CobN